jgi:hypothetical protein
MFICCALVVYARGFLYNHGYFIYVTMCRLEPVLTNDAVLNGWHGFKPLTLFAKARGRMTHMPEC